ncbi:DUF2235 domain-containing protein [Nocardia terpenica]|nr:DUF2235 domain-containing protein [Nocardia terpenica]
MDFREEHSHYPVSVKFLGTFEAVGALGVPEVTSWRYRFHDVQLSPYVKTARQALAIDERRRALPVGGQRRGGSAAAAAARPGQASVVQRLTHRYR